MASAQVASNSKKGHLEAGKRRLEEFRKKKAEGRVKKTPSIGQQQSTIVDQYEKQPQENQYNRLLDSDGSTAERDNISEQESSGLVTSSDGKPNNSYNTIGLGSSSGIHDIPPLPASSHNVYYTVPKSAEDHESKWYYDSGGHKEPLYQSDNRQEEVNNHYPSNYNETQRIPTDEVTTDQYILNPINGIGDTDRNIYHSSHYSMGEAELYGDGNLTKEASLKDSGTSHASVTSISSEKSDISPVQHRVPLASSSLRGSTSSLNKDSIHSASNLTESFPEDGHTHTGVNFSGSILFQKGEGRLSSIASPEPHTNRAPQQSSKSLSTVSSLNINSSFNHTSLNSMVPETGSRRTRPSFLDSVNVPSISSASHLPLPRSENTEPFMFGSSKAQSDTVPSAAFRQPFTDNATFGSFDKFRNPNLPSMYDSSNNLVSASNEREMLNQSVNDKRVETKLEFPTAKQDENFAALEQHIEDLTQEKFSLQRALDASRALAESLASENSSLTDSYNQQRNVVNQLKFDMERLQEEIGAHLQELDSVKMEYTNAQLECNAADERAKILASEVIGLEEKALKLRSSELKLERQLENSDAEIASYKKKVSSLVKERQDLQNTVDALKEEKKLLQSKLRKASGSGKSFEVIKTPPTMKDASTSVDDLDDEVSNFVRDENSGEDLPKNTFDHEIHDSASFISSSSPLLHGSADFHIPVASAEIPPDQLRTVANISLLISELALEKEELMQALASESSRSSKLKELNMELSRKLEAQTQRLELLTAQSMVSENNETRGAELRVPQDRITYTDEGDEVVERVLGWIMKLFPGGASKRRTSKLV